MQNLQYTHSSSYLFSLENFNELTEFAYKIENFSYNPQIVNDGTFMYVTPIKFTYYDTPHLTKLLKMYGEIIRFEFIQLNNDNNPMRSFVGNAEIKEFKFGKFSYEDNNSPSSVIIKLDLTDVQLTDIGNPQNTNYINMDAE